MLSIYAVNISKINNYPITNLFKYISFERVQQINKYLKREDALRSLISELLSRAITCQSLGIHNNMISINKTQYGKPYIKGYTDFHYNVSHSGEWVVCAVHNNEIGIDIEQHKPIDLSIAKRFFCEEEYKELVILQNQSRINHFYKLWTLKESLFKAIGKGLSIPLNSCRFMITEGDINYRPSIDFDKKYFRLYSFDSNYTVALCSTKYIYEESIEVLNMHEILKMLE